MKRNPKSRLGLAVGAALGVACLAPATSFGWSIDTENGALVADSAGDTLLFPIYTVAEGAKTAFSVTNTSMTQTVAAKIRFREQVHSMDVLDFIVVLSPNDKFDFWVTQGAETPRMAWNDNTCVVGPSSSGVQSFVPAGQNQFVETNEQMSVGHLEVLGMADLSQTTLAADALHNANGVPADCGALVAALGSQTEVAALIAGEYGGPLQDVDNVLVGRYVITDADGGIEAGSDAYAIRDTNFGLYAQSGRVCTTNCVTNIGAVLPGDQTTPTYAWSKDEWSHPHLGEMAFFTGFQTALTADWVGGDWSNNPANFVGVDWVISFPSKYTYLDYIAGKWTLLANTPAPISGTPSAWTGADTTDLCLLDNALDVYDTEEQETEEGVSVSPGFKTQYDICNELNVMTLYAEGQVPRPSVIQTSARRNAIQFTGLDAVRGWAAMELSWGPGANGGAIGGIVFTQRSTVDPAFANGSITELQKRQAPQPN